MKNIMNKLKSSKGNKPVDEKPKCSECKIAKSKSNLYSENLDPHTASLVIKNYCAKCWKKRNKVNYKKLGR